MASSIFVNGPAHLFIGTPSTVDPATVIAPPTYLYLGQTEGDLMLSDSMLEADIHVDASGPAVPADVQYLGQEAYLQGTLIKYVEAAWQLLQARVSGGVLGTITAQDIGTLLKAEKKFFALAVTSPYHSKTAFAAMTSGFTFPFCYLAHNADTSLSTQKKRHRISLRCIPDWTAAGDAGVLYYPGLPGDTVNSVAIPGALPAIS